MFTSTASAGLALGLSPTIFTGLDRVIAQEAGSPASNQAAESGGVFTMPQGDFASEPSSGGEPVEIPFRSPTPEAELQRLKSLGGQCASRPEAPDCVDRAPAGEPVPPSGDGEPGSKE